jgi:hypothetical protein
VARELKSLLNYPELCQALIDNCSLWIELMLMATVLVAFDVMRKLLRLIFLEKSD